MTGEPTFAAVCGDPGGAAAVLPALVRLHDAHGIRFATFGYNQGEAMLRGAGFAPAAIPADADGAWAADRLRASGASLLIAATSDNGLDHEKAFVAAARALGMPSLAVLDFWSNYARRFNIGADPLAGLADVIAVMDEDARDGLIAVGVPPEAIRVTGHPGLDGLLAQRDRFGAADRAAIREAAGAPDGALLVLFASQPFQSGSDVSILDSDTFGYEAHAVRGAVADALGRIARRHDTPIHLLVRPHPRETLEESDSCDGLLTVRVWRGGDRHAIAQAADLVTGMNSMLLVEACLLGRPVVSVQPGLRVPDVLPTNGTGRSVPVYQWEAIETTLERLLFDPHAREQLLARNAAAGHRGDATERVAASALAALEHTGRGQSTTWART